MTADQDGRITRFSPDLELDTAFRMFGSSFGTIVVVHGRFAPSRRDRWAVEDYALDVYDGRGVKQLEDVPVPGRFVGIDGNTLYFVVSEPPDGWVVKGYGERATGTP